LETRPSQPVSVKTTINHPHVGRWQAGTANMANGGHGLRIGSCRNSAPLPAIRQRDFSAGLENPSFN